VHKFSWLKNLSRFNLKLPIPSSKKNKTPNFYKIYKFCGNKHKKNNLKKFSCQFTGKKKTRKPKGKRKLTALCFKNTIQLSAKEFFVFTEHKTQLQNLQVNQRAKIMYGTVNYVGETIWLLRSTDGAV
jgi:hypothetical protein